MFSLTGPVLARFSINTNRFETESCMVPTQNVSFPMRVSDLDEGILSCFRGVVLLPNDQEKGFLCN
jgi:hypothetical protein